MAFREPVLRGAFGLNGDAEEELRKVWNVLVEKELRIHIDLEEWFEARTDAQGIDSTNRLGDENFGRRLPIVLPEDEINADGE